MDTCARQLAELTKARAELITLLGDTLRKLGNARTAQFVANEAHFPLDMPIDLNDGDTPISPLQLADMVREFESEVARIREMIAQVDNRLAQVAAAIPGIVH